MNANVKQAPALPASDSNSGKLFRFDFGKGKLVEMARENLLPVGSVVNYGDCANPRKRYAVTAATCGEYGHGQTCICEDGHRSTVHASDPDAYGNTSAGGWHYERNRETGEPVILDAAALAEFVTTAEATGAQLKIEREAAANTKAEAREQERARLLVEFAYLEKLEGSKKSPHALGAANLRRVLARTFPGVKFSVTSDIFSGGDSVDAHWTDGPTHDEVDRVADQFQYSDFNSMEDLSENRDSVFPDLFGGAKYVHCHRHVAPETMIKVAADLGYTITSGRGGEAVGVDFETQQMIYREARGRSYYVAPAAPDPVAESQSVSPVGVTVRLNAEKNGVELVFPSKPAADILERVKAAGFRWSRFAACWYAKQSPGALEFAHSIARGAA